MNRVACLVALTSPLLVGQLLRGEQSREPGSASKAQVLIIGADHAPTCFLSAPGYTNGHIRVVLNHFRPTMVGIESNPVWMSRGILNRVTYEAQVVVDWAAKEKIPVYGLDWANLEQLAEANKRGLKFARQPDPPAPGLRELGDQARRAAASQKPFFDALAKHPTDLFNWLNTSGSEERGVQRAERLRKGAGPEVESLRALDYRNARIAEQILALVRRYPSARLAVVMGFAHKWPLEQKLAPAADVEVVPWAALTAVSAQEVAAAWVPKDSIGTLRESLDGALYYFDPEGVPTELVREHLNRLERAGIDSEEVRYLRARSLTLQKKYGEAEALLRPLGRSESGKGFSYRLTNGWWEFPVAFMARVEMAKLEDLKGDREQAVTRYKAALADLEKITPAVPADDSFRDIEAWVTDGHFAFYRVWTCQAARRALQSMIKEPFGNAYRGSQPVP